MMFTFEEINETLFSMTLKSDKGVEVQIFIDDIGNVVDEVFVGEGVYHCMDDDLYYIAVMVGGEFKSINQISNNARTQFSFLRDEHEQEKREENSANYLMGEFV